MATTTPQIRTETNGPMVTTIACVFSATALIFTALRFYTRGTILKAIGTDDWAMLIATVFSIGNAICMTFEVKYGMGRHQEAVGEQEGVDQLKFLMGSVLLYNMGMNVVKLGFLFQYKRIFQDPVIQKICFWSTIGVCIWAVVQALLLSFACLPLKFIVPSMEGKCLETLTTWYISSGTSMATDIAIFCIPLPSVWKLQLPIKQKIMVLGIFCLGFFVCIISVYRLFTLHSAANSLDPSWENIGAAIWSCIELNVSILASSLPTLRPLLARLLPGLGLSRASKDRSAYLRYGGSTLASPRATNFSGSKGGGMASSASKRNRAASISTEELALGDLTAPGSIAASMYANASVDNGQGGGGAHGSEKQQQAQYYYQQQHQQQQFSGQSQNAGRIVRTTEISVQTGDRL
ncbi:hypothetical protein RB595_003796 [Gaeumannomyces hyphopodioides]